MNKKLLAVAVAGALAVPGVAFAQTNVTISGFFKVSLDQVSFTGASNGPAGGAVAVGGLGGGRYGNTTESRVTDNSSRLIFNVREDLGNGLAAVGQLDIRFNPPSSENFNNTQVGAITANGNTWVGLTSTQWGTMTFGKWDLNYGKGDNPIVANGAGALQSSTISLLDVVARPVAANVGTNAPATTSNVAIANTTRTPNVVRWQSPNWNGFDGIVAWSANPLSGISADLGTTTLGASGVAGAGPNAAPAGGFNQQNRKGYGWNINPRYTASNWGIEYSYWNAKADPNSANASAQLGFFAAAAMPDDQRADVVAGYFEMAGWRVGAAWNHMKTTSVATGLVTGDRDAYSIPITYTMGPHRFGYTYAHTNDSKSVTNPANTALSISGSGTGATMNNLYYEYNMSKRTALGLTFSQIQNKSAAAYTYFTGNSGSLGSANSTALAGEKARLFSATIMHRF